LITTLIDLMGPAIDTAKRAEVPYLALVTEGSMLLLSSGGGSAHHHAAVVNALGNAKFPAEGAKIDDCSVTSP
jgi:hypothetical protein